MKKSVMVAAMALSVASSAFAGVNTWSLVGTNGGTKTNTNAYAGLNWSLGGGWTPSVVVGVFNTRVSANGNTEGANLAFHVNLAGGIKPGKLKLSYLNGQENLQGELGIGYDFMRGAPLLTLGANAPFVALGADGYLNGNIVPFLTVHTQKEFNKPGRGQQCVLDINGIYDDNTCTTLYVD